MSVSATGKATSLFLLLQVITGKVGMEKGKGEETFCPLVWKHSEVFRVWKWEWLVHSRAVIQLRIKYHPSPNTCRAGGAATTLRAPRILPAASTGFGSSLGPQLELPGAPVPNSHSSSRSCHSSQVALDQQQQLPRSPPAITPGWWWQFSPAIASLTLVWPLCLTNLVLNLGGPRQHLKCQKEKKGENFKSGRLCKPRQLLTARWETKNGKLDTAQLLLSSLQSSGNESSKIDSCGKPDWWFSLMGWDTQGQMWKMLFKWLVDTDEF